MQAVFKQTAQTNILKFPGLLTSRLPNWSVDPQILEYQSILYRLVSSGEFNPKDVSSAEWVNNCVFAFELGGLSKIAPTP